MNGKITRLTPWTRAMAGVVLMAGATVGLLGSANAEAQTATAVVRAAHFSPTTPGVDVYLGAFTGGPSKLWLSSVSYGAVSPYQRITPGLYTVAMRPHGAATTSPPMLSWTLDARTGSAYTVAGVGAGAAVRGVVIGDDLTPPAAGKGRVRVIQAASRAPQVTVTANNGAVIAKSAAFATTTPYTTVAAGTWKLSATDPSAMISASSSISVEPGVSTSVLLLDAKSSGITVRTVLDSSSTGTVPVGSVPAGGGGMAGLLNFSGDSGSTPVAGLLVLVAAAGGGAAWAGRRRVTVSSGAGHAQ